MLSLSQADRLVLGTDLNRSESRCGAPDPYAFHPVTGGGCCTAGFRAGQCPLWVNRVGPTQPTASPDVRFTSNSVRISAGHGTDGKYQKRTHAPQQTDGMGQAYSITSSARARSIGERATEKVLGSYRPGTCILRSAQLLRSATVKRSRKGFALIIFSRLVRPVVSAVAITRAASAFSIADRIATAPAPPAK
jgi:hypothetical protein